MSEQQRPKCPRCEREVWPVMDQVTRPDGRVMHAYCWLKQKSEDARKAQKERGG